jgi:hypothetical protein
MTQIHPDRAPAAATETDATPVGAVGAEVIAFPAPRPAAGIRPEPSSAPAPAGEVIEGEIVYEEEPPGREVAVVSPAGAELVAAWQAARARAVATLARPDRIAWALVRHEIYFGALGSARGVAALWAWLSARELDTHLATNPKMVLDTRSMRKKVAGGVAGTVAAAGGAAWVAFGPVAPVLALLLVLAVAGAVERTRRGVATAEAGRAALGPSPSGKEVKRAVVAAGLARRVEDLRIIGPVTRAGAAWEAVAELPPGTTYKAATKKRGELAAAIGVDEVQVAVDPVRGHNGRVRIWCADEDPMQGERVENPLAGRTRPFSVWRDRVFAGRDARGREVSFSLVERSYLIGGEPGGGKSVASNNILGAVSCDPTVRLFLADGKFGFDLAAYEPLAEHVVTQPGHIPMMAMLETVRAEMGRRYALLRKIGTTKVTEEVARKYDLHPIVLHIDEIQTWSASGVSSEEREFIVALSDIVGRGRAAAIITGAVTQRPAAEVVPTRLRDILSIRWALRCTTPTASDTILGAGRATSGYSAAMFTADQRGAGFLLAEGASPVQLRSAFMTEQETQRVTRRAHEWRREAGTLPATADRPEVRLLTAVLEAMGATPKGSHTADLLPALAAVDAAYEGWDAARLSGALRPLGVAPVQLDIGGRNRNGYRRGDVQAALERV